jgi:hypothetical protein
MLLRPVKRRAPLGDFNCERSPTTVRSPKPATRDGRAARIVLMTPELRRRRARKGQSKCTNSLEGRADEGDPVNGMSSQSASMTVNAVRALLQPT